MIDDQTHQLLRALIRLEQADPFAYSLLEDFLFKEIEDSMKSLTNLAEPVDFYRAQGRVKALEIIKRHVHKPNNLLQEIEKNLS